MSTNYIRVAIRVSILASLLFTLVFAAQPSQAASYTCSTCIQMANSCRNLTCATYGFDSQECADCEAEVGNCVDTCTP